MHSNEFLLQDTRGLELEIERHCISLGLDWADKYQVHVYAREMMQNMEQLKTAASHGDRVAKVKTELYGLALLMHEANIKAFGPAYMKHISALGKRESAWIAIAKAVWVELERSDLDDE